MAENAPPTPTNTFAPVEGLMEAPIIYFEFCPTLGNNNGIINVMLVASIIDPTADGGIQTRIRAAGHLRMTAAAALNLRDTIDKALLIGVPVENPGGKAN